MSLPPFQHLVDEHWRDVARLAHALAPGNGDDVAQQAWTKALVAYPGLAHARNLRSWLLTITHHCAMDHHRAARRTVAHDDPASLAEAPVLLPPEAPDGDLWARVAALPERQREAVVLRFVADLDHRAIAAALGTSPGMSRRLLSDAVATLRLDLDVEPNRRRTGTHPPDGVEATRRRTGTLSPDDGARRTTHPEDPA